MRMVTCDNGHYYDQEKHASCPYCASRAGAGGYTQQTVRAGDDDGKTALYQPASEPEANGNDKTQYNAFAVPPGEAVPDVGSTTSESSEPILLAGWLAISTDAGRGSSYTLTFGLNTIGRSDSNHVSIQNGDSAISREKHATIIYDYSNNLFYVKHEDGQYLTYVNGEVLLETRQLNPYDKIRVGATELVFVPLCGDAFRWEA